MLTFVSGAARSGKSDWAERAAAAMSGDGPKIYLATAMVNDEDMRRRVERHREARRGRGFVTVERPFDLSGAVPSIPEDATVLLECLPNWAANEMFRDAAPRRAEDVRDKIQRDALCLASRCRNLVIVSDDVFSDGVMYGGATEEYLRLLGNLHVILAREADAAVEVASGIPRFVRGGLRTVPT